MPETLTDRSALPIDVSGGFRRFRAWRFWMSSTVMRWFGNGQSVRSDPAEAGAEAVRAALQGRRPALLMIFASMPYANQEMISAAHAEAGGDVPLIGCSTSGEFGPAGRGHGVL